MKCGERVVLPNEVHVVRGTPSRTRAAKSSTRLQKGTRWSEKMTTVTSASFGPSIGLPDMTRHLQTEVSSSSALLRVSCLSPLSGLMPAGSCW